MDLMEISSIMGAMSLEGTTYQNDNSDIRNRQVTLALPILNEDNATKAYAKLTAC